MSGNEIREKIIKNNEIIENANHSIFVLNDAVKNALEENMKLRTICQHEYAYDESEKVNRCIYCGAAMELN